MSTWICSSMRKLRDELLRRSAVRYAPRRGAFRIYDDQRGIALGSEGVLEPRLLRFAVLRVDAHLDVRAHPRAYGLLLEELIECAAMWAPIEIGRGSWR